MYFACRRPQAATLVFRCGVTRSTFSCLEKASWRTRRMARRKRNVSDLPYAAPPLFCVAFFVKEQKRHDNHRQRKGGRCRVYLIP